MIFKYYLLCNQSSKNYYCVISKSYLLFGRWSNDGKHFVSGSVDGSIKIWDAVSNRCIATFLQAHDGDEVCSVTFSRNGKYVLSSGKVGHK
jgi:WD40 repeat protein